MKLTIILGAMLSVAVAATGRAGDLNNLPNATAVRVGDPSNPTEQRRSFTITDTNIIAELVRAVQNAPGEWRRETSNVASNYQRFVFLRDTNVLAVMGLGHQWLIVEENGERRLKEISKELEHEIATFGQARGRPWKESKWRAGLTPGEAAKVYHYSLQAGGPQSFTGLTNAPSANPVRIAFVDWNNGSATFRLTNRESHRILLWNVRVQSRSAGLGTDGLGWDTIYDDYPEPTGKLDSSRFEPGQVGEFLARLPDKMPWRVCVLYSVDWTDSGKTFSGNYEGISEELNE